MAWKTSSDGKLIWVAEDTTTAPTQIAKAATNLTSQLSGQQSYLQTLQEAGFSNISKDNLAEIQKSISSGGIARREDENDTDYQMRVQSAQEALSNLSSSYSSANTAASQITGNMTAEQLAASKLPQRGGYNETIADAVYKTGDTNYINSWLATLSPEERNRAGNFVAQNRNKYSQYGVSTQGGMSMQQTQYSDGRASAVTSTNTLTPYATGGASYYFDENGIMSAPSFTADTDARTRSNLTAIYEENKKLAAEREKEISLRTATDINIGEQLADIRSQNEAYQTQLQSSLGITGIDDMLVELENRYGLLVNRKDPEFQKALSETALAQGSGETAPEEIKYGIANAVFKYGQKVEDLAPETATMESGVTSEVSGTPTTDVSMTEEAPVVSDFSAPSTIRYDQKATGAIYDSVQNITTYTDTSTGLTFYSPVGVQTIDWSKMNEVDLANLDGISLAKAEYAMFSQDTDNIMAMTLQSLENTQKRMASMTEVYVNDILAIRDNTDEAARIEMEKSKDDLEIQRMQSLFDKDVALDTIATEQAKTEAYFKGKLSAYGASDSSAALAIMSATNVKFAKLKSQTQAQFSIQDQQIMNMTNYVGLAYANTLRDNALQTTKSLNELVLGTNNTIAELSDRALITAAEMQRGKNNAKINYIKEVKAIKSAEIEAQEQAAKDSIDTMYKYSQILQNMAEMTGTIWQVDGQGLPFDTGEATFAAQKETFQQNLDISKFNLDVAQEDRATIKTQADILNMIKDVDPFVIGASDNGKKDLFTTLAASLGGNLTATFGNSRAVRNNNPGNLRSAATQSGTDDGFATFNSMEDGFNALMADVKAKQTGNTSTGLDGNSPLLQMIEKYAPKEDGNDPVAYANTVASRLGIDVNTPIGQIDTEKLALEIARHEDGNAYQALVSGATGETNVNDNVALVRDKFRNDALNLMSEFTSSDEGGQATGTVGDAFTVAKIAWEEATADFGEKEYDNPFERIIDINTANEVVLEALDGLGTLNSSDKQNVMKSLRAYQDAVELYSMLNMTESPEDMALMIATSGNSDGTIATFEKMVSEGQLAQENLDKAITLGKNSTEFKKLISLNNKLKKLSAEKIMVQEGLIRGAHQGPGAMTTYDARIKKIQDEMGELAGVIYNDKNNPLRETLFNEKSWFLPFLGGALGDIEEFYQKQQNISQRKEELMNSF